MDRARRAELAAVEVVARVEFRIEPRAGNRIARWLAGRRIEQHWTLGRRGDRWELLAVSDEPVSDCRRLVPTPWHDHDHLHGESLRELADDDPFVPRAGENLPGDAAARVRDLSLVDGRYARPVIESVLARLLDGWEQAALGRPELLRQLATVQAQRQLLPGSDPLWRLAGSTDPRRAAR